MDDDVFVRILSAMEGQNPPSEHYLGALFGKSNLHRLRNVDSVGIGRCTLVPLDVDALDIICVGCVVLNAGIPVGR